MNLLGIDLNLLDQRTDDRTLRFGVAGVQARAHLVGEFLHSTDHQAQLRPLILLLLQPLPFRLQFGQSLPGNIHISLKPIRLDASVGVHLHQSRDPLLDLADQLVQALTGASRFPELVLSAQPPLEFLDRLLGLQPPRQHARPHRLVQTFDSDRGVATDANFPRGSDPLRTPSSGSSGVSCALGPTPVSIATGLAHH